MFLKNNDIILYYNFGVLLYSGAAVVGVVHDKIDHVAGILNTHNCLYI